MGDENYEKARPVISVHFTYGDVFAYVTVGELTSLHDLGLRTLLTSQLESSQAYMM